MFADDMIIYTLGENTDDITQTLQSFSTKSTHGVCQTLIAHELKSKAIFISTQELCWPPALFEIRKSYN